MNCEGLEPWRWTRILPYGILKTISPCGARYVPNYDPNTQVIKDAGWHFSFMGGADEWVKKLESTPHQEYNKPEFKDKAVMLERVRDGKDLLGRDIPYRVVEVDETFPRFVLDNLQRFKDNQFIMHPESYHFVERVKNEYPDFFHHKKVLEVGSLDINGSVRQFFQDCDYTGLDLAQGKGVDIVSIAHEFIQPETYDVVISSEMLEHDEHWEKSLKQMYANLKPGGLFILSCAGPTRPEHGTKRTDTYSSPFTTDYYRNISQEDLKRALPFDGFSECTIGYDRGLEDLHFWGLKQGELKAGRTSLTLVNNMPLTVTAEISTRDRYTTTLPMCISAILNQTRKPEKLVIYDDGEQADLRELSPFKGLLALADDLGIKWEIFATPRKGQVTNHQHCLDQATTTTIWRVDDDEISEPDCLERLLACMANDVGAVGGLVHHPGNVSPLPDFLDGSMRDIQSGLNIAWFNWNGNNEPIETEHLYSTFLYRVEAAKKAGGYPKTLSSVGHREETILTASMKRAGWKLLITPHAKTYHLRESSGGIRSFSDQSLWEHDEKVFQSYLTEWGMNGGKPTKLIVLDCGIGDHFAFKSILPEIKKRHADKELVLSVCFPEVFKDDNLKLISIADAKNILGERYEDSNLYKHLWSIDNKKHLVEAMLEFWG
jgi:SAM-dependent methyltransferase